MRCESTLTSICVVLARGWPKLDSSRGCVVIRPSGFYAEMRKVSRLFGFSAKSSMITVISNEILPEAYGGSFEFDR